MAGIKYDGNGTVVVKTWFAMLSGLVFIVATAISVYAFIQYDPLRNDLESNTVQLKNHQIRIETLERMESARIERDEWIKQTLKDLTVKIDRLVENSRK
jgi:hypothetical protein